jgi:hypothetical protein
MASEIDVVDCKVIKSYSPCLAEFHPRTTLQTRLSDSSSRKSSQFLHSLLYVLNIRASSRILTAASAR